MLKIKNLTAFLLLMTLSLLCLAAEEAQPQKPDASKSSASDLAKATQNPVADLISVPFQWNSYFNTGPKGKTQNVLLIQPVIPMSLNEEFNFIARPIIPLIDRPPYTDDQKRNIGVGNIQFEGFFSPKEPTESGWITGLEPYFEFPTNSGPDGYFGSDNWSADNNDRWTIPVGGGIGKVFMIGKQPVNAQLKAYYNVDKPKYGPDWQLQFQLQLMFPRSIIQKTGKIKSIM